MADVTAVSVVAYPLDARCLEESVASLHLRWRPSSSLAIAWEVAIKPEGSAARLFLEAGSFVDRLILFPTASLSLDLDDTEPACCCG